VKGTKMGTAVRFYKFTLRYVRQLTDISVGGEYLSLSTY